MQLSKIVAPEGCKIIDHKVKIKGENKGYYLNYEILGNGQCFYIEGRKKHEGEQTIIESRVKMLGPELILSSKPMDKNFYEEYDIKEEDFFLPYEETRQPHIVDVEDENEENDDDDVL
jgi:hypothetical protein